MQMIREQKVDTGSVQQGIAASTMLGDAGIVSTEAKLEYPRLPVEQDRRRVLTEREILEMQELRSQGFSSRRIAAMYFVSKTIVLYHTNDDEYREKVNKKRYAIIKQKEKVSKVYREERKEAKREWQKSALKRSEAKRKYKGKKTYQWKKKKRNTDIDFRKKDNEQSLRSYHKRRSKNADESSSASIA